MTNVTPAFTIRDATLEEAVLLAEAQREIAKIPGRLASRPSELEDAEFLKLIAHLTNSPTGKCIVIVSGGMVVGHAYLEPLELEVISHIVHLTIAVHEGHQAKGFGKALLTFLIDWARANPKIEKIVLHVRSSNKQAISLYEKLGFVVEGVSAKAIKLGPNQYLDNVAMALWVGN